MPKNIQKSTKKRQKRAKRIGIESPVYRGAVPPGRKKKGSVFFHRPNTPQTDYPKNARAGPDRRTRPCAAGKHQGYHCGQRGYVEPPTVSSGERRVAAAERDYLSKDIFFTATCCSVRRTYRYVPLARPDPSNETLYRPAGCTPSTSMRTWRPSMS